MLRYLLLALFFSLPSAGWPQGFSKNPAYHAPRGPITIRNARPYHLLFLQFLPESPDTLPPGKTRFDFQLDFINNLLLPNPDGGARVIEDNEMQRVTLSWRRGIAAGTELGVFVPILWRNGGFMDEILSWWHRIWGIPGRAEDNPAGRDSRPAYQSLLYLEDADGHTLVHRGNAFGLGEVSLTLKRSLLPSTPRAALALRFGLKLPTGNRRQLLGSGGIDAGLMLDGRYNIGRDLILYAGFGGILMSKAGRVPGAQPSMLQHLLALEYRPNNRDSFLWQLDGSTRAVRVGNAFADRMAATATFGYKRVLDRHLVLALAFSENGDFHNYTLPFLSNIGPDFSTTMALEWHP